MKKIILVLAALLLLAGCASSSKAEYDGEPVSYSPSANKVEAENVYPSVTTGNEDHGSTVMTQKVIVTSEVRMESSDLDKTLELINAALSQYGGYIQSSSIENSSSYYNRTAYLTIRVPAERFNAFLEQVNQQGNLLSQHTTTDDITESYYDLQSRIASLKEQRERVMQFYQQANSIEELITVEKRLSEIDSEIAAREVTMANYELLTTYSTVTYSVYEVKQYSDPVSDNFFTRLSQHMASAGRNFLSFLEEAVFFVVDSFWFILLAVIVLFAGIRVLKAHPIRLPFRKKERAQKPDDPSLQ